MSTKDRARILSQDLLQEGIYSLRIQTEAAKTAVAGQFLSLYLMDRTRLLPRPISICEIDQKNAELRLVYRVAGDGTKELSSYRAGEELEILGPLGNGFYRKGEPLWKGASRVLLVGGGIGVPPMVGLAAAIAGGKNAVDAGSQTAEGQISAEAAGNAAEGQNNAEAAQNTPEVISVMGYRDKNTFLTEELQRYGALYIATDDGSLGTKGTVLDAIREQSLTADLILSCGPKPMLRGLKVYAKEEGIPLFVSMEERMACGVGACLGCVCETAKTDAHSHVNNARVCKDGPVFAAEDVIL